MSLLGFLGNNWGCEDGTCGLGYGPQEEFWGCSDITIRAGNGPRPTEPRPTTTRPTVPPVTTQQITTTTTAPPSPPPTGQRICRGHGAFSGLNFDTYCTENCNHYPPYCPSDVCICDN